MFVAKKELDPVCSLSELEKLRLCATFYAASVFKRNDIVFTPRIENVQLDCRKRRIRIKTPIFAPVVRIFTRLIVNPHRTYEEWVIGCQASTQNNDESITHFISRGIYRNTIFAFTECSETRQLLVYSFFNNISVIGDLKSEEGQDAGTGETNPTAN